MNVELEHGLHDPHTNVGDDNPHVTAKITLAHLNEFPDYYTRLERMEEGARRDWRQPSSGAASPAAVNQPPQDRMRKDRVEQGPPAATANSSSSRWQLLRRCPWPTR
jgi:Protein of unknown function (DUF5661)